MIEKHIIRDNKLYIFINYNYEFANFNNEDNLTTLERIKKYMKDKNINFNGKFIVFVVAGIAVMTMNFTQYDVTEDFEYVSNIDNKITETFNPTQNTEVSQETTNEQTNTTTDNIPPTQESEIITPSIQENIQQESPSSVTTQQITIYRSNGTVITLSLEEYLIGVVGSEMPASFNIEALKSQAIAARTYALNKINNNQTVTDTTKDQVYKDNNQLKSLWGEGYDKYYQKVKQAVSETEGLVLTYDNKLISAVYHSTSNGFTENAEDVWGNSVPYLKAVSSTYDKNASSYLRQSTFNYSDIDILNLDSYINIVRDSSGNVIQITVDNNVYTGVEFRNLLGLRSTDFDIIINNNTIEITTKGYGHGVGMSQYGANGMANNGYNYNQILKHYYTGVAIEKIY